MLNAASQANGVCARGSDVLAPNALFQSGTIETGSLSALRVRSTVNVFFRSAPALEKGSAPTKNNASAKRPAALVVRNNNCFAIGLPSTRRNKPSLFQTRKRPPNWPTTLADPTKLAIDSSNGDGRSLTRDDRRSKQASQAREEFAVRHRRAAPV
jgi:hypothetical protein